MVTAYARCNAVHYANSRGVSKRRAGALFNISGSSLRYKPRSNGWDLDVVEQMKVLSVANSRYGYRFVAALRRRDGLVINDKRAYRLWKKAGLVHKRKPAYQRKYGGGHR